MLLGLILWIPSIIVVCLVSMALSATEFPPLSGVLMCKEKCLNTKGCERLAYSSLTFTCYLQGDVIPSFETSAHKININKDDMIHVDETKCNPRDRILRTRQGSMRCVSDGMSKSSKSTRQPVKASRLLFSLRRGQSRVPFSQVNLQQKELKTQPYRYISLKKVYSLLYSPVTNSLYVACFSRTRFVISVSKLDTRPRKRDSIIGIKNIRAMALDEARGWILLCRQSFGGVYKIVGRKEERLFKYKRMTVSSMAVCAESETIYVGSYMQIYTFMYSGKNDTLVKTNGIGPLHLDPQGKYLYYDTLVEKNYYIIRYNIVTKTFIRFIQLSDPLEDIAVDSDSLYVKHQNADIVVYDLATKKRTGKIHIRPMEDRILCLVM